MATWDKGKDDFFCPHCGAKYRRRWIDLPARDKGSATCECCKRVMFEWKGTRGYVVFDLLRKPTTVAPNRAGGTEDPVEVTFIATAWNNGQHHASGAGDGLKVSGSDRDKHFRRERGTVELRLPTRDQPVRVNIDRDSFWNAPCRALISAEIGCWLLKA